MTIIPNACSCKLLRTTSRACRPASMVGSVVSAISIGAPIAIATSLPRFRNLMPIPALQRPDAMTTRCETARSGCPVAPASQTAPDCATPAGPRGPSTVNAAGRPAAMSRLQLDAARATPPREVDPRAVPYPKRRMIRAIHSPSKFSLVMTMIRGRGSRASPARIRPCQKAKIG